MIIVLEEYRENLDLQNTQVNMTPKWLAIRQLLPKHIYWTDMVEKQHKVWQFLHLKCPK